jgi:hypothetical protein
MIKQNWQAFLQTNLGKKNRKAPNKITARMRKERLDLYNRNTKANSSL